MSTSQQADEYEHKKQLRAAVKQREEEIRDAREAERARIEKMNEDMCVLTTFSYHCYPSHLKTYLLSPAYVSPALRDRYLMRVREKELAIQKREKEVSKMEKVEMQLIQKLKNTQQLQQRAFFELESALNGSS